MLSHPNSTQIARMSAISFVDGIPGQDEEVMEDDANEPEAVQLEALRQV